MAASGLRHGHSMTPWGDRSDAGGDSLPLLLGSPNVDRLMYGPQSGSCSTNVPGSTIAAGRHNFPGGEGMIIDAQINDNDNDNITPEQL